MANALHQRLKRFLARFAGVSIRRLSYCLAWFEWFEQTRRLGSQSARLMSGRAAAGRYENPRTTLAAVPQPFWEY